MAHPAKASLSSFGGLRLSRKLKSSAGQPLISVITVTFNAKSKLRHTVSSVLGQKYGNVEFIVIDGASSDGTVELLHEFDQAIDYWISEPDRGIYDAMNKGIRLASGPWLNFMNAGDSFADCATLQRLVDEQLSRTTNASAYFYSDVVLLSTRKDGSTRRRNFTTNHVSGIVNHQASIYAKRLHDDYGMYVVAPRVTISDYLFMSLVPRSDFRKVDFPIALYETSGVSQSKRSVQQKFIVDFLINGYSAPRFIAYFLFYYYYREAKAFLADIAERIHQLPKAGKGDRG